MFANHISSLVTVDIAAAGAAAVTAAKEAGTAAATAAEEAGTVVALVAVAVEAGFASVIVVAVG